MDLIVVAEVGGAGGLGAATRYVVDATLPTRHATLVINVTGSLVLGVLTGLVAFHAAPSALTLVGGTGVCGGYTTFSAASLDALRSGRPVRRAGVAVVLAVAAAAAGMALASL